MVLGPWVGKRCTCGCNGWHVQGKTFTYSVLTFIGEEPQVGTLVVGEEEVDMWTFKRGRPATEEEEAAWRLS